MGLLTTVFIAAAVAEIFDTLQSKRVKIIAFTLGPDMPVGCGEILRAQKRDRAMGTASVSEAEAEYLAGQIDIHRRGRMWTIKARRDSKLFV